MMYQSLSRMMPKLLEASQPSLPTLLSRQGEEKPISQQERRLNRKPSNGAGSTITIFDWDDTLLCTSALQKWEGKSSINSVLRSFGSMPSSRPQGSNRVLQLIDEAVCSLLSAALELGPVFIITNARSGWVQKSAAQYLPRVASILETVVIISARDSFENQYPSNVSQWKIQAFLDMAAEVNMQNYRHLIVVGDSEFEMNAVDELDRVFSKLNVKAVKFRANPSATDLLHELRLVQHNWPIFRDSRTSLSITLERNRPSETSRLSL